MSKDSARLQLVSPSTARAIKPPWKRAVVLVCRECSGNKNGDLRSWLKGRVKEEGLKKDVKVLAVKCLGVCPKRRVTVVVSPNNGSAKTYVVGEEERESLFRILRDGEAEGA